MPDIECATGWHMVHYEPHSLFDLEPLPHIEDSWWGSDEAKELKRQGDINFWTRQLTLAEGEKRRVEKDIATAAKRLTELGGWI